MLWHPDTGDIHDVAYDIHDGLTTVHLDLTANDAVFVVFQQQALPRHQKSLPLGEVGGALPLGEVGGALAITTPWTVHFDKQWGGPETVVFDKLISYTDAEDKGIKYYSGTATYHNKLSIAESELGQGRLCLDLGRVGCMAEVIINGKSLGVLWKAPYTLDVTHALKAGDNELEIRVVNQWVNRIIGDRQPDCETTYTYTPRSFYRADSPLLPAGLMGPVTVRKMRDER